MQEVQRVFGIFSQDGTIDIPVGYAILDLCTLETGGFGSNSFCLGLTPGNSEIFYGAIYGNAYAEAASLSQSFFSTTGPTTIYVNNGGKPWGGMAINLVFVLVKMV